jgi:hypothetical protein
MTEEQCHCAKQSTSLNVMQNWTELRAVRTTAVRAEGGATSQPRGPNADSSGQVTKDRHNCIKMVDQENSKFQTTRFKNLREYSVLTVQCIDSTVY